MSASIKEPTIFTAISKGRSKRLSVAIALVIFLLILVLYSYTYIPEELRTEIILLCIDTAVPLIAAEYIKRLSYIFVEYKYLDLYHQNNIWTLFYNVFYTNWAIVSTAIALIAYIYAEKLSLDFYKFIIVITIKLILDLFCLEKSPLQMAHCIDGANGSDFGSGMAHSYFRGYLEIVLPHTGTELKGIKELMEDYEAKEDVKFLVYKLFILIPRSLRCPTSLNQDSDMIEKSRSLDSIKRDRAGVVERVYKNSVYKIKTKKRKFYVAAEYASPLKTLEDIINKSHPHANHYKRYKHEILVEFYKTLQSLLRNDKNCADVCELIFYDDVNSEVDIGKLLLKQIYSNMKLEDKMIK